MRGLCKAAALFAPTVSALAVNAGDSNGGRSFAVVSVGVPAESRQTALDFRLDVLPSEQVCGFGNVTVNDQVLPQTLVGELLSGGGSVSTDRMNTVVASWTFDCIKVDGESHLQLLQFIIKYIDGKAMEDVGFAVLFRQTENPEIVHIDTGLSMKEFIAQELRPDHSRPELNDVPAINIEVELAELEWMKAQLDELKHLIHMKERMIEDLAHHSTNKNMHGIYAKIQGGHGNRKSGSFSKCRKDGKAENHTDGPPKEYHTFAHPPHHQPHFPLPVCRYLPPGHPGIHPHDRPHHGPTPYGPHHDLIEHETGPYGKPSGFPHGPEGHRRPSHQSHEEYSSLEGFDEDKPAHHESPNGHFEHHGLPGAPHDHDYGPSNDFGPKELEPPKHDTGPQGPPSEKPFAPHDFPPLRGPPMGPPHNSKALYMAKIGIIGFLLTMLIIALHWRFRGTHKRTEHRPRREERHRRRVMRRAARKQVISKLFAKIRGKNFDDNSEGGEEEKYGSLNDAEEGQSKSLSDELVEFRNAIEVVTEMVSASNISQPRPQPQGQSISTRRTMGFGTMSEDYASEGEELPAYEGSDDSDSSVVADGFRYTPGSSEYTPAHSASSSVSGIFGSDAKS
ncbi:hypothetical protein B7494_g1701 [Chlorociboria aeruginascens]|nr:hypothetical protein B7494_g1701 [Chlorociboria aeruginascens]